MPENVTDFDVMKAISRANGPIGSSPLTNMLSLQRVSRGYQITLGISHEWGDRVMRDECVGAIYFIERAAFHDAKKRLAEEVAEKDAEIARLREALEWYRDMVSDCRKVTSEGDAARKALDRDGGAKARAALGQEEGR